MNSNFIVVALFLGALLVGAVAWALLLRAGLRWAKVAGVSNKKLLVATLISLGLSWCTRIVFFVTDANVPGSQELVFGLIWLVITATVPWLVISRVFRIGKLKAIQAWLPTILSPLVGLCLVTFIIRPCVAGGFIARGNNMAPTVLGQHRQGVCPVCGKPNYRLAANTSSPMTAICENFHMAEIENDLQESVRDGDGL